MKLKILIFLLCAFIHNARYLQAQNRFRGGIVAGFNAAQLNGDAAAGYHKVGLNVGVKALIELKGRFDMSTELLFSQRGARTTENQAFINRSCTLNYLEVPILLNIRDWKKVTEDGIDYYKVSLSLGISYGRLFKATSNPTFTHTTVLDKFNNTDISIVGGVNYQANRNWGFSLRMTRSINRLFNPNKYINDPVAYTLTPLKGHFLTFQTGWIF